MVHLKSLGENKPKPRIHLNCDLLLGPGLFIKGGIFGGGIYNLANNIQLELNESENLDTIQVRGTLNSPQMESDVYFYEGTLTIFDGVYQLMPDEQQQHYFKEFPEYQSRNMVQISTEYNQDLLASRLIYNFNIRALRIKDERFQLKIFQHLVMNIVRFHLILMVSLFRGYQCKSVRI